MDISGNRERQKRCTASFPEISAETYTGGKEGLAGRGCLKTAPYSGSTMKRMVYNCETPYNDLQLRGHVKIEAIYLSCRATEANVVKSSIGSTREVLRVFTNHKLFLYSGKGGELSG